MLTLDKMLLKLLNYDTQNSDEGLEGETIGLLNYVKERLGSQDISCEIHEYCLENRNQKERGIMLAKKGKSPYILLQGHVDTVPFDKSKWLYNPLGEKINDKIYGRGSVDMKGPVAGLISTFEEVKIGKNEEGVMLLLTSDEEAHGFAGIKYFLKKNKEEIRFGICGEPSNLKVKNKGKGAMYYTIETFGKEAHGSRPDLGENAINKMISILDTLKDYENFVFQQEDDELGNSTMNIGKIVGGKKVNQVPGNCKVEFEIRPVKPASFYNNTLENKLKNEISMEYDLNKIFGYNPIRVSRNHFLENLEFSFNKNGLNHKYKKMDGFSEATFLNEQGIPTIVFGPGDSSLAHTEGTERIKLDDIIRYKNILLDFIQLTK